MGAPRRWSLLSPGTTTVGVVSVLVGLRVLLDFTRLASNPRAYWNAEEAHTAGVAWYVWHAGLWDQLLNLQYKSFCGGCTVFAVIGAPVIGWGGDNFALWKGIALMWTGLTLIAAFVAVDLSAGRAAAWGALVALAVPPVGLSDVSLMLWGNHSESALWVAVAMALLGPTGRVRAGRAFALGVWLGASLWFTRTSLYAVVVIAGVSSWRAMGGGNAWRARAPGLLAPLAGIALGASLLLVPAANGDAGYYDLSLLANVFPHGLAAAAERGSALVRPATLAAHLFRSLGGMGGLTTLWLLGVAAGACFAVAAPSARRVLPWVALMLVFWLLYSMSGVPVSDVGPHAGVIHSRYQAPWMFLLLVLGGAAAGEGIRTGGAARGFGVGIALALGVPSVIGWAASLRTAHITPGLLDIAAVNHSDFAHIAAWRMPEDRVAGALAAPALHRTDAGGAEGQRVTRSWLGRMQGYRAAQVGGANSADLDVLNRLGSDAAVEGFAEALTDPRSPWPSLRDLNLAALPPAYGRGVGFSLGLGYLEEASARGRGPRLTPAAAPAAVKRAVDELRSGLLPGAPCTACVAAGAVAITHCRQPIVEATAACLRLAVGGLGDAVGGLGDAVGGLGDGDEVMYGAGVYCQKAGFPRSVCGRVPAGAAFVAGVHDPMAGAEHPVRLNSSR